MTRRDRREPPKHGDASGPTIRFALEKGAADFEQAVEIAARARLSEEFGREDADRIWDSEGPFQTGRKLNAIWGAIREHSEYLEWATHALDTHLKKSDGSR